MLKYGHCNTNGNDNFKKDYLKDKWTEGLSVNTTQQLDNRKFIMF